MQNLLDICCGLDVHKEVLVACLLKGRLDEEPEPEIREFPTLLNGLDEFKKWIIENNCRHVAMESTGVYWFPIYNVLESILYDDDEQKNVKIIVANPHHRYKRCSLDCNTPEGRSPGTKLYPTQKNPRAARLDTLPGYPDKRNGRT